MSGYIVYGQALYDAHRTEEAAAVFQEALRIDPENIIALRHLGDIARTNGDLESAAIWYERVLGVEPKNEEVAGYLDSMRASIRGETIPSGVEAQTTQPHDAHESLALDASSGAYDMSHDIAYDAESQAEHSSILESSTDSVETTYWSEPSDHSALGAAADADASAYDEGSSLAPQVSWIEQLAAQTEESERTTEVEPITSNPFDATAFEETHATEDELGVLRASEVDEFGYPVFQDGEEGRPETLPAELDATAATQGDPSDTLADSDISWGGNDPALSSYGMPASMDPAMREAAQSAYRAVPEPSEAPSVDSDVHASDALEVASASAPDLGDVSPAAGVESPEVLASEPPAAPEPVVGHSQKEGSDVLGEREVASPFVTETMAELYLQQGFLGEALSVYRQLAVQRNEPHLHYKVQELEARVRDALGDLDEPASAPSVSTDAAEAMPMITEYSVVHGTVASGAASSRPTPRVVRGERVRDFFIRLGARRPDGPSSVRMAESMAQAAFDEELDVSNDAEVPVGAGGLSTLFASSGVSADDDRAASLLAHAFVPRGPLARHDSVSLPPIQ